MKYALIFLAGCGPAFTVAPPDAGDAPYETMPITEASQPPTDAAEPSEAAALTIPDASPDVAPMATPDASPEAAPISEASAPPVCSEGDVQCTSNRAGTMACHGNAWDVSACATGQTCTAGICQCPAGQTDCGSGCVNTQADSLHCGSCFQQCSRTASCVSGTCHS